jgi:Leucine Rich repeat
MALGLGYAWPDRYKHFWSTSRTSEQAVLGTRSEDDETAGRVPIDRLFVARGMGSWLLVDAIGMPVGGLAEGLRHEPLVDIAFWLNTPEAWGRVAGPALQRLRRLGLRIPARGADPTRVVAPAFDDPHLTRVQSLDLGPASGVIAPEVIARLLASPLAARLRRVSCAPWAEALAALASAPPGLPWEAVSFRLPAVFEVPANVSAMIFDLPFRGNLRELGLAKAKVGDAGAVSLAAGGWPRLERLDLTDARLTDDGFRALAAAPFVRQLTHVRLGMNHVTDEGVCPLAAALDATRVREFAVSAFRLSAEAVAALRDRFGPRFAEY